MNYTVTLPKSGPKPSYYEAYVGYMKKILEYNKVPYTLEGSVNTGEVSFPTATKYLMRINDKRVVIDYSDNIDHMPNWHEFDATFKFHYVEHKQGDLSTVYPFAPISFHNWKRYYQLRKSIRYTCSSDLVLNMQRPGGNAIKRRIEVQKMLQKQYGGRVLTHFNASQENYWSKINDCLLHVFVPGCRNDMIDRGHLQYMAFGCCTISPKIIDVLPYDGHLIPDEHYVECASDYSDLIEKIEYCRTHRDFCIEIGRKGQELFEQSCSPDKLWDWIIEKVYG